MVDIAAVLSHFNININEANHAFSTGANFGSSEGASVKQIISPVDGKLIASVTMATAADYNTVADKASEAFIQWRTLPAPKRGEIVRQIGVALRENKDQLGKLVSYEMGKSLQEGWGEVQEMIDICDFAVGLSRQLYGNTMPSERANHRMYDQYHPLGVVGIISAFNFPVAVWSWNAMLAWVCGNTCIWKPSEKTPFTAIACQYIIQQVFAKNNIAEGVSCLVIGDRVIGEQMAADTRVALVSATGSTRMGKAVAVTVAQRLGKYLLELGGNNAVIISQDANMEIALVGAVFGAVGTAGQRCTTTRRLSADPYR
jgi:aldehyde dehydrogenase (NAD+)